MYIVYSLSIEQAQLKMVDLTNKYQELIVCKTGVEENIQIAEMKYNEIVNMHDARKKILIESTAIALKNEQRKLTVSMFL